jgi:hypothetical protein
MDLPALPTTYLTWLLGQSVAVVILLTWIWTLHRREKHRERQSSEEMTALRKRNDELSDSLVNVLLETSRERSERRESMLMAALGAIEKRLDE